MKTIKEAITVSLQHAVDTNFVDFRPSAGICANVYYDLKKNQTLIIPDRTRSFVGTIYGILQKTFVTWPYYSGELGYPIPSTTKVSPLEHYKAMRKINGMYKGEYGRLRRDLSLWVIKELSKDS